MSEPDDRRPVWMMPLVLVAVVAGIVVVSLVAEKLPRGSDRGVEPSIPAAVTSTTMATLSVLGPMPGTTVYLEFVVDRYDPLSTSIGRVQFTAWRLPEGWERLSSMTATAHGVVAILERHTWDEDSMSLVWSDDGVTWTGVPITPSAIVSEPLGIAVDGDDLVVYGEGGVGAARLVWDGARWVEKGALGIAQYVQSLYQVVVGSHGMVVTARPTPILYSTDGVEFHEAEQPPSRYSNTDDAFSDEERCTPNLWLSLSSRTVFGFWPVVATTDGFVALTPRRASDWAAEPVCEPSVWYSTDGNIWESTSEGFPFGPHAFVYGVVVRDGRLVAVGGVGVGEVGTDDVQGAVWTSETGLTWERADVQLATAEQLAAGTRGWILLGHSTYPTVEPWVGQMWVSADGITWDGPCDLPTEWSGFGYTTDLAFLNNRVVGIASGPDPDSPGERASFVIVGKFIDDTAEEKPVPVLTPVDWQIVLDDWGPGIHSVNTIVDAYPLDVGDVEDLSGRLFWDETVVDLCRIGVREVEDDHILVGDIFQTTEGCGSNPTAMQDAFDEYGLPDTACVTVTVDGINHEYCSPLNQADRVR